MLTYSSTVGIESDARLVIRYHTDVSTHKGSFFKSLVDQEVTVELKNDISIRGTLKSVDQYLNIKLEAVQVMDELKFPHLVRPISAIFTPGKDEEEREPPLDVSLADGSMRSSRPSRTSSYVEA